MHTLMAFFHVLCLDICLPFLSYFFVKKYLLVGAMGQWVSESVSLVLHALSLRNFKTVNSAQ